MVAELRETSLVLPPKQAVSEESQHYCQWRSVYKIIYTNFHGAEPV
jgi:hypothetical protein